MTWTTHILQSTCEIVEFEREEPDGSRVWKRFEGEEMEGRRQGRREDGKPNIPRHTEMRVDARERAR
jgi:hypothetical protein